MAFDCHWILINEVSTEEIMRRSQSEFYEKFCWKCTFQLQMGTEEREPEKILISVVTFSTSKQKNKTTFQVSSKDNVLGSYESSRI